MRRRVHFPESTGYGNGELRYLTGELELAGSSLAALATAFAIDDFKTAVDMGRCSALLAAQQTVLLTHCHSDHVAGLVAWLSAHTRRHAGTPTRVVVPASRRQALLDALLLWPDLDGVRRRVNLDEALIAALPGDRIELTGGDWARCFEVHHSAPSLGWAVGKRGAQRPSFVFAGDGTVIPFVKDPALLDASMAIVDCSFIESGTRVAARLGGHGHLKDWLALLLRLSCDTLVLAHLPVELRAEDILEQIGDIESGPTLVPWIEAPAGG